MWGDGERDRGPSGGMVGGVGMGTERDAGSVARGTGEGEIKAKNLDGPATRVEGMMSVAKRTGRGKGGPRVGCPTNFTCLIPDKL